MTTSSPATAPVEPCAHCASAHSMTAQAFENRIPPPEAIRGALLLGVVVGQRDDLEELPACADCKKHLLQLHEMVFGEPPAEEANVSASAAVPAP